MTGLADRDDQFRPDLEGLRAVAVLLVLLYHARIVGFSGGYVGVDVFFVLSGFFITGAIDRELRRTGRVNVTAFYARRARRLLPAAAIVLLATLAGSILILPSFTIRGVSIDIASAGLYVSNLRFGIEANDYFKATVFPSPVLHFWSLSLEEQFYLFWPAALLVARRLPLGPTERRRIVVAIAVMGLVSLVAGIWLTGVNQPWAFFLLPTRAWELAIGGLIAVGFSEVRRLPRRAASLATPIGVGLILVANFAFDDSTPFPGTAALVPVLGSALVIIGGLRDGTSVTARGLSVAPMRYREYRLLALPLALAADRPRDSGVGCGGGAPAGDRLDRRRGTEPARDRGADALRSLHRDNRAPEPRPGRHGHGPYRRRLRRDDHPTDPDASFGR